MPMTLKQIEHEIDLLPKPQVDRLFEYISQRRVISEHDRIWAEEAERRFQALKAGKTTARPAEEVFKDLEQRLAAKKC